MSLAKVAIGLLCLVAIQLADVGTVEAGDDPVLRIEAGMHIAPIVAMATDAANRIVATGSEDKTIRLWSLPGGRPAAILRIPIGHGSVGKIYAVAVSPDGATVAVGGWTTSGREDQVYLLDSRSGNLIRRLTGLPDVTASLAFSPDGHFLMAGLGGRRGIIVYDAKHEWRRVATDADYGGVVQGSAFDTTGRLATSCSDGIVRLYAAGQFDRPRVTKRFDGRLNQLAFSPGGRQLAVAFGDRPKVAVLSTANLSAVFSPDVSGLDDAKGGFHAVTWSADGDFLIAGGSLLSGGTHWLRRWSAGGRGAFLDLPAANDTIRSLLPLRNGDVLFATMDPTLGVITPSGAVRILQSSGKLDFRSRTGASLSTSNSGDAIDVDTAFPLHRLSFDLRDRVIGSDQDLETRLASPHTAGRGLSVTGWHDGLAPRLNNSALTLERFETARSLAVEPDGNSFMLGTSWRLVRFDSTGRVLWSKATEGAVWNTTITADGRVVIAAQGDGTIRWRRLSDGAEVLALFVTPDMRRWVAWTPGGYYDASPGGESLIGWQVDQGPDTAPTFHPAWQFRDRFYRPDVVARIIATLDEPAALGGPGAKAKGIESPEPAVPVAAAANIANMAPPTVSIYDSPDSSTSPRIVLGYQIAPAPAEGDAVTMNATIDGRRITPSYVKPRPGGLGELGLVIPEGIPDKTLEVTLTASDAHGPSEPASVKVQWHGSAAKDQKPVLYIVAVGIGKYPHLGAADANLTYPSKDAEDFAAAMSAQKGRLYSDVKKTVLIDDQATLANIRRQLRLLKKQMAEQDVAAVFLSGHGAPPEQDWAFVPYDAVLDDEDSQLSGEDLNRWISELPGIKLLFLDSCFSGAALRDRGLGTFHSPRDKNRTINVLTTAPSGVVVFSSSMGDQQSWEDPDSHHGAYTEALLEGLSGMAGGPEVGMNALEDYLDRRVRAMTKQKQTPTMIPSYGMPSITIAVVGEGGK